jgi:hypothetical protein
VRRNSWYTIPLCESRDCIEVLISQSHSSRLSHSRARASRKSRNSGFGIPLTREGSGSGSSSGSKGGFTSTSDEDEDDSTSILSSQEDEIDYSFRYRDSTFGKAKPSLLSPPNAAGPGTSPSKPQSPALSRSRTKSSLPKRSFVTSKGGLAVREDEWERWERLSREQVLVSRLCFLFSLSPFKLTNT